VYLEIWLHIKYFWVHYSFSAVYFFVGLKKINENFDFE